MKGSESILSINKLINIKDISKTVISISFFLRFIALCVGA
jgi:hypothetical protein